MHVPAMSVPVHVILSEKVALLKETKELGDFPGNPVVKNVPCKAEDAGLDPWSGNKHFTCCGAAKPTPQLQSPCGTTRESLRHSERTAGRGKDPSCAN